MFKFKMPTESTQVHTAVPVQEDSLPAQNNNRNILLGAVAYTGIVITGMSVGAAIGTYVFFGTVMLAGTVVVIENIPILKVIVSKSTKLLDFSILCASIYATIAFGTTISASLTVAGLGYTLIYAPYIRSTALD